MKIWSPTLIQTHACKICQEDLMRSSEWIRTSPKEPLAFEPANKHCICLTNAVDGVNHFLLLSKINRWCGNVDGTYYKSGQWRWKTWCALIIHVLCVCCNTPHTYMQTLLPLESLPLCCLAVHWAHKYKNAPVADYALCLPLPLPLSTVSCSLIHT